MWEGNIQLDDITLQDLKEHNLHPWTSKYEVRTLLDSLDYKYLGYLNDGIRNVPDIKYDTFSFGFDDHEMLSINFEFGIYFITDMS